MHKEMKEKLEMFFDGELPPAEQVSLRAHLESCADCRLAQEKLALLRTALAPAGQINPSENFVQNVMLKIEALENSQPAEARAEIPAFWRWLFPAFGYLGAAVLMVAAIMSRQTPVSAESVLLEDMPAGSHWTVVAEPPDTGLILEE